MVNKIKKILSIVIIYFIIGLLISIVMCFISFNVFPQNTIVKSSYYIRTTPISIYANSGYLKDRLTNNIEIGKSFDVIDLGLCLGSYSQRRDTTTFLEGKITMDASQYGIYSNEFSLGCGYVFNSNTPLMLDFSYTIIAQIHNKLGVGITTGYYDFSGIRYDISRNYYGLFLRYGLIRDINGKLNKTKNHHRK